MAPSDSPEARELALVEKVELRIALAETDEKLESLLKTYLPPLLLKLGSDHVVRDKVHTGLVHSSLSDYPKMRFKDPAANISLTYSSI